MATDAGLAAELANAAGALLRDLRAAGADGGRGDREANQLLLEGLAAARPGDAVLSEESPDDRTRVGRDRVWIIDPLDGTREFGLPGRDDWAVHVALWTADAGIGAAAVALPARREVYTSEQPVPPPGRPGGRRLRFVVSDSRPPAFTASLGDALDAEVVPMGSAGAKAMAVLRGDADAYVHAGGQWEWDSAAPVGVALASGAHASRLDGSPLRYNQPHPYLPDLVLCQPWLAGTLLDALGQVVD
jgi:3'(2'), 5'-bisphosphate nucleotidase